jgi:asparagine synthase (glutamine-hydrolysing)
MVSVAGPEELPCWFVALPDCASAPAVAARLRGPVTREICHRSGRPWLVGSWPEDAMALGEAGEAKVALIGHHALTAAELATVAARTDEPADLDRLVSSLVGSSHLIASIAGRTRIQGTLTGLRRVFYAEIGGVVVAADRADVLARLRDAGLDEQRLAAHLLDSCALHQLADEAVWRGVSVLATDRYLVLELDGRHRSVRWWRPPAPVVPMSAGAPALRAALWAAVDARVRGRDLVTCDLGGLDSTSICSLAARLGAELVAYTVDGRDPAAQDAMWARRTVAALGGVEHHVIRGDRFPPVYAGLRDGGAHADEPCAVAAFRRRALFLPLQAAARGSRLHLTGFGGDELLAGSPAHLHGLLRTHPRLALRRARGFATQRRWGYRETLRQLVDNRPYREWVARAGDRLTAPPPAADAPTLGWGAESRMPPWATPDAVAAARGLIRAAAAHDPKPLAEQRGQHVELEAMRVTSRFVRYLAQMTAGSGLELAAPYYDDRVVEAGLSVRPQERVTPWRYKPLIAEAMSGIVPAESLRRHTKDEGSYEVATGLREQRGELLALCEDSRLARLGLIDADVLREVCSRPLAPSMSFTALYQTVACEAWLRTLERVAVAC